MSKRLRHDLTYDAAMVDVAAMLADPEFREEVCEQQHVLRALVSVDADEDGMEVTIDQVQAATGRPVVREEVRRRRDQHRPDARPGRPRPRARSGDHPRQARRDERQHPARARPTACTTETVDLDIKVGIPLVGGKIEGLIADLLLKALKVENRVGRDYLSR